MNRLRHLRSGVNLGILLAAASLAAAESKPDLTGTWVLNAELSQEQVKERSGSGFGGVRPSISVGGIGVPLPGGSPPASPSGGKLKDPDVLFCQELEIAVLDEVVMVRYQGLGEEEMLPGRHQGKKVRWTGSKLTEQYETTSRKVDKRFELKSPNQMLVTVRLNPREGSTRVYRKVFERAVVDSPAAVQVESESTAAP